MSDGRWTMDDGRCSDCRRILKLVRWRLWVLSEEVHPASAAGVGLGLGKGGLCGLVGLWHMAWANLQDPD